MLLYYTFLKKFNKKNVILEDGIKKQLKFIKLDEYLLNPFYQMNLKT